VSQRVGRWSLAALSFLLCLFVAEGVLTWVEGGPATPESDAAPVYSWGLYTSRGERIGRQGLQKLALHPFALYFNLPGQETRWFTTDARGFRRGGGGEGDARIALVGGSTAFGTGLESDGDTFAAHLARRLGAEVVNAAVIGHLSGQELAYLVHELVDLEPRLVVALDGWNDLWDQTQGPRRTVHTAAVNQTFFDIEDRLRRLHRLETGSLPQRTFGALALVLPNLARLVAGVGAAEAAPGTDDPGDPDGSIDPTPEVLGRIYAENARKMHRVAAAFGASYLCVLQPDRRELTAGRNAFEPTSYRRFRATARDLLERAEVPHLDLNERSGLLRPRMFLDRIHLDASGNDAMARAVAATVRERGLLETAAPGREGPRLAPWSGPAAAR